jgi:hypothetical protein
MQPLYTETEFKQAKSRQLLPLQCLICGKAFQLPKNFIQRNMSPNRLKTYNLPGSFCSTVCLGESRNKRTACLCEQCGATFIKAQSQIKKYKHNFCSHSCAATYNNTHKTKGTRVSKLEVWLSKQLPQLYPSLEFHFNRKDAINSELDIYIPSLKLAFELNGIFHYEPIYGNDKLVSRQNNDNRKILACAEREIELCVIDVSRQNYFKEKTSIQFLNIIQKIINLRLLTSESAS